MAKAQYTVEFMLSLVTLFFLYALLLPHIQASLSFAQSEFNNTIQQALIEQITWKAKEVSVLEDGSMLSAVVYSPFAFDFILNKKQISILPGQNELYFVKTGQEVEITS